MKTYAQLMEAPTLKSLAKKILQVDYEVVGKKVIVTLGHEIDPENIYKFKSEMLAHGNTLVVDDSDPYEEVIYVYKKGEKLRLLPSDIETLKSAYKAKSSMMDNVGFKNSTLRNYSNYKITVKEFNDIMS